MNEVGFSCGSDGEEPVLGVGEFVYLLFSFCPGCVNSGCAAFAHRVVFACVGLQCVYGGRVNGKLVAVVN